MDWRVPVTCATDKVFYVLVNHYWSLTSIVGTLGKHGYNFDEKFGWWVWGN